jgi:hypothetical protein
LNECLKIVYCRCCWVSATLKFVILIVKMQGEQWMFCVLIKFRSP